MVYGAILEKGEEWYTDLDAVFTAIGGMPERYHWLITDWELAADVEEMDFHSPYVWLSSAQLKEILEKYNSPQWIWAVISGFDESVPLEEVLKYPLSYADGYRGFWENPISMQHPLANIEIVPWDSTLVLLLSKKKEDVARFRRTYPLSEDLEEYNKKFLK